jgi:diguanylate cyclase
MSRAANFPHEAKILSHRRAAPQIVLACAAAAMMLRSLFLPAALPKYIAGLVDGWIFNGVQLAAGLLVFIVGRRRSDERSAWTIIAVGFTVWCTGNVWWSVFIDPNAVVVPPSIPDALWMASYPILFLGMVRLLRVRMGGTISKVALLDGAIAGSAVTAIAAMLSLTKLVDPAASPNEAFFGVIYPVLDIISLGLIAGMASAAGLTVIRSLRTLVFGMVLFAVADVSYYLRAVAGVSDNRGWDTLWTIALAVIAFAPLAKRPASRTTNLAFGTAVAAISGVSSLTVLVIGNLTEIGTFALISSTTTIVFVIARVTSSFRHHQTLLEAHRLQAISDPLTGLANRRKLMEHLDQLMTDEQSAAISMIDLDGFKRFNDTNGHLAGDELLIRYAQLLCAEFDQRHGSSIYRLGGDEFCIVAIGLEVQALENHLKSFVQLCVASDIPFSYGSARFATNDGSVSETLSLADTRLYAQKRAKQRPVDQKEDAIVSAAT